MKHKAQFLFVGITMAICCCLLSGCLNNNPDKKNAEIQGIDKFGELVNDHYDQLSFIGSYGPNFKVAYTNLKSERDGFFESLHREYRNSKIWNADSIEIRFKNCPVRNTLNDTLVYTSVDFYMYNIEPYHSYCLVMYYRVIDSMGHVYTRLFSSE